MEDAKEKKRTKYEHRSSYLDMYINHCIGLASRSPDPSTKVGCVIIDQNCQILAQGFNGEVSGGEVRNKAHDPAMKSFSELVERSTVSKINQGAKVVALRAATNFTVVLGINAQLYNTVTKPENERTEDEQNLCKECQSSTGADSAIHAEMNAVLYSEIPRTRFENSIAIVSLMPCPQCYKLLAQLKVKWVLVLSDSGRYIQTLKDMIKLSNAPRIITLDKLLEHINPDYCCNAKVFKSKLAKFYTARNLAKIPKFEDDLLAKFDHDYDFVRIEYHDDFDKINDLARILFRLN